MLTGGFPTYKQYLIRKPAQSTTSRSTGTTTATKGMAMMLPPAIPFRKELVLPTGLLEVVAAVGLLAKKYTVRTAWGLIVFFVLVLPANLYAAWQRVNYQAADFTGPGPAYLWFRIPLQLLFIGWVYYFGIKPAFSRCV